MPPYKDLHNLPEDERIAMIGEKARTQVVGFFVDDDAKAGRYIAKLKVKFPSVQVLHRGPFQGKVVLVKVGPSGEGAKQ